MHFTIPDICNQNGCLILVTLQKFKYRTNPNVATLYSKTSETETLKHFIVAGPHSKVLHLIVQLLSVFYCQFVVILAWLCHIEEVVPLIVDNG